MRHLLTFSLFLTLISPGLSQGRVNKTDRTTTARLVTRKNKDGTLSGKWRSPLWGHSISCRVRLPESAAKSHPVAVYLKNLPTPRLGTLDDATLIKGFLGHPGTFTMILSDAARCAITDRKFDSA